MDRMLGSVVRRDDVMAQICELVGAGGPRGADALLGMAPEGATDADTTDAAGVPVLESWTHIEIDRETSVDILDSVRAELVAVLHDVRAATRDWSAMLEAVQAVTVEIEEKPPP